MGGRLCGALGRWVCLPRVLLRVLRLRARLQAHREVRGEHLEGHGGDQGQVKEGKRKRKRTRKKNRKRNRTNKKNSRRVRISHKMSLFSLSSSTFCQPYSVLGRRV